MTIIVIVGALDLVMDISLMKGFFHQLIEIGFILFAVFSGTYMWFSFNKSQIELSTSRKEVSALTLERDNWRAKHETAIQGMQDAIKNQLALWGLSSSEIEVALYLMRGYSHKQIGGLLEKSERTVRNQSLNVYNKSGMSGRSELTAFFLEDLFSFDETD